MKISSSAKSGSGKLIAFQRPKQAGRNKDVDCIHCLAKARPKCVRDPSGMPESSKVCQ